MHWHKDNLHFLCVTILSMIKTLDKTKQIRMLYDCLKKYITLQIQNPKHFGDFTDHKIKSVNILVHSHLLYGNESNGLLGLTHDLLIALISHQRFQKLCNIDFEIKGSLLDNRW